MTEAKIIKMLRNFDLDTLAPDERVYYNNCIDFGNDKVDSLIDVINYYKYLSENLKSIAELITEYKIEI